MVESSKLPVAEVWRICMPPGVSIPSVLGSLCSRNNHSCWAFHMAPATHIQYETRFAESGTQRGR